MTQELTTTRSAGGDIKTTTPGAPSAGYGALFDALIRQKMAQQTYQRSQAQAPAPQMERAAYREAPRQPAPQMGTGKASSSESSGGRVLATRMRSVPQNPYDAMARIPGGLGGTGNTNTARPERFIEGVGWEFEGDPAMNPSGPSGGIIGGGNPELTHSSSNLQAQMPAYSTGSPDSGMDYSPLTGLPRYKTEAPVAPTRTGSYYNATRGKN